MARMCRTCAPLEPIELRTVGGLVRRMSRRLAPQWHGASFNQVDKSVYTFELCVYTFVREVGTMKTTATRPASLDGAERTTLASLPPIFSYAQARQAGLSQRRIYWLRDQGLIEPLTQGTYRRAGAGLDADPDLVEIATRASRATLCLASALARHDLTDAIPAKIDIALPRGTRRPPTAAPVKWHVFDADMFDIGRDTLALTGDARIGLYGAERSIIDAFRLRHQEGTDLAHEALKRWLGRRGSSPAELIRMAHHFPKALPSLRAALEILL